MRKRLRASFVSKRKNTTLRVCAGRKVTIKCTTANKRAEEVAESDSLESGWGRGEGENCFPSHGNASKSRVASARDVKANAATIV